ncbi:lysine-specific demethylase 4-like [Frankliniella occidentalis]|uniref:Lysine-specific demethylase 4-like n=1 Tax=Frankliniella occidentalis TaxID=133901 RepID=A0A9C6XCH3_FRAOC|nr:lysine-specific demethylase 4-like [Frankliniella occidentalis]
MDKGHTSCRALLVDHKVLIANPKYFFDLHGIPYTTALQEPGDFMITFPFALHAGFNMGHNLAMAANFGDPDWVQLGIYAPTCMCNVDQIQLDFTEIVRSCRPDLMDTYNNQTLLMFPRTHPMEVRYPERSDEESGKVVESSKVNSETTSTRQPLKNRTIICPKCKQTFQENKIARCKKHIAAKHPEDSVNLCRLVDASYPAYKPKTTQDNTCPVCKRFLRGSTFHLNFHMKRFHSD